MDGEGGAEGGSTEEQLKRGKRKSSWSCESVFPDCLAAPMTSFSEVLLIGLENRTSSPGSPSALSPAHPLCPALLPSPTLSLRGSQCPGLCQDSLPRLNEPHIPMSSSRLFILETPRAKAVMSARLWRGDWHQSPGKGESLALSSVTIPGVRGAPGTEKARGSTQRGAGGWVGEAGW